MDEKVNDKITVVACSLGKYTHFSLRVEDNHYLIGEPGWVVNGVIAWDPNSDMRIVYDMRNNPAIRRLLDEGVNRRQLFALNLARVLADTGWRA